MTSIIIMIIVVAISSVIVKISSVALEMTGMDKKKARFQALSAFTGTGFTTKDSEEIVKNDKRRRIVMALMILGNAGLVSVVAALVVSMRAAGPTVFLRVVVLVLALYLIYRLMSNRAIMRRFGKAIEKRLASSGVLEKRRLEEVLRMADDYVVAEVVIEEDSPNAGRSLKDSTLRENDVLVIAIERSGKVIAAPRADRKLKPSDSVVCYGKLEGIKKALGPARGGEVE